VSWEKEENECWWEKEENECWGGRWGVVSFSFSTVVTLSPP